MSRALRGGSVFVALSLIQRALPFILLPAFAAVLSPQEYGRIAFLVATVSILSALLGLGIEPWVVRTYVQLSGEPERRARFVNTIGLFALSAPAGGAAVALAAFEGLPALRHFEPDGVLVLMAFVAAALQTTSTVFVGALLRAQERLRPYALVTLVQGAVGPLLALLFVVVLGHGVRGWFGATLLGAAGSLVLGFWLIRHRWSGRMSPGLIRTALLFGIPLLPHAISHWVLNLSDRIVLTALVGSAEVGVYNLAYQLVAPIGLVLIALRQALMPIYPVAAHDSGLREEIAEISTVQVHVTGLLGLAVGVLGPGVLWLAFPDSYRGGAEFVPWVALGFVCFGLYLVPVDSLSLMLGRTRWIWLPTAVAAITNVALNLTFVPVLGALAAAVNTAISYAVLLAGMVLLRLAESGPHVPYDVRRMAVGLGLAGGAWLGATIIIPAADRLDSLALRGLFVLAAGFAMLIYDLPWWRSGRNRRVAASPSDPPQEELESARVTQATGPWPRSRRCNRAPSRPFPTTRGSARGVRS